MDNNPLVSVIVPVYNVEKYLDNCVNSIVRQSYENIEIILVDDGSTDTSGEKCEAWKQKDSRVQVIHKSNDGLNNARQSGWEISTGEYITFLDSDDFFHKDNIKNSLSCLIMLNADAVIYAYKQFTDKDEKTIEASSELTTFVKELSEKNQIARYALLGDQNLPDTHSMTVWGKLYKRNLVEKIDWKISNYRAYEDNFWTPQALFNAKKVVLISDHLVFYRRNVEYGSFGSDVLSTKMIGNSWNDEPVGYLELLDRMEKFYQELVKKHQIKDINEDLHELIFTNQFGRMEGLIHTNLLGEENNLDYVKKLWQEHKQRDISIQHENARLSSEIARLQGIKASARRFAGNIKRRVKGER